MRLFSARTRRPPRPPALLDDIEIAMICDAISSGRAAAIPAEKGADLRFTISALRRASEEA